MSLQRLTLVLNASYEPINIVSVRRAMCMLIKEKAHVESYSDFQVRTGMGYLRAPSIIRLDEYRKIPHMTRAVSRKNIMLRDRYTCQYCLKVLLPKQLTLDHVMPRSRGGGGVWENLVACCYPCNNRKADRTPAEAGLVLAHKPARIGIHARHRLLIGSSEPAWDKYMYV